MDVDTDYEQCATDLRQKWTVERPVDVIANLRRRIGSGHGVQLFEQERDLKGVNIERTETPEDTRKGRL